MVQRYIIQVAKDKAAMQAIDYDENTPEQVIEWRPSESEIRFLFDSGIIHEINHRCNVIIGYYEDHEIVGPEKLRKALLVLKEHRKWPLRNKIEKQLTGLVEEAIARDTAVYFFSSSVIIKAVAVAKGLRTACSDS